MSGSLDAFLKGGNPEDGNPAPEPEAPRPTPEAASRQWWRWRQGQAAGNHQGRADAARAGR